MKIKSMSWTFWGVDGDVPVFIAGTIIKQMSTSLFHSSMRKLTSQRTSGALMDGKEVKRQ